MHALRPYQAKTVRDLWGYWRLGKGNAPLIVAPTGSGKSHIIAHVCKAIISKTPDTKILMLTHRAELIEQNTKKLTELGLEIGIWAASLQSKEIGEQITAAQIQSFVNCDFALRFDLLIIDEAHLVPPDGEGQYQYVLKRLWALNPKMRVLGLTATPYRLGQGKLTDGDKAIFDGIASEIDIESLIELKALVPPITKEAKIPIDVAKISKNPGGDYKISEQESEADKILDAALTEICHNGADRKAWLIFCPGLELVGKVMQHPALDGIKCAKIDGKMAKSRRKSIINEFRAGKIRCIVSCDVVTTGFDAPCVDLIALLRCTASPGLYVQMVGRGLRPAPGKKNCLVFDYGRNVIRHGPINFTRAPRPKGKGIQMPPAFTVCPVCMSHISTRSKACNFCGNVIPRNPMPSIDDSASSAPIIGKPQEWIDIVYVDYVRHYKDGKPDSIRVIYSDADMLCYNEWLCPEHGGYAAMKWQARKPTLGATSDKVSEILQEAYTYPKVVRILVDNTKKYPEIKKIEYEQKQESFNF